MFRFILVALFSLFLHIATPASAQCAMCKMPAESNLANGGTDGKGLNKGIIYMFITPYLIVGTIGFLWWKNRRKNDDENEEEVISA